MSANDPKRTAASDTRFEILTPERLECYPATVIREGWMRRREFIAGLGGAAAWPATLVAQVPTRRPLVAYLAMASPEASATMVSAFLQSLRELGYRDGHDCVSVCGR
jgi:hypothetical protein